jgi:thioredoxin reductase
MEKENKKIYQLIILGGGPAGTAAGVYAARKKIDTLLITESFGGQAINASIIENFIGFERINGLEMAKLFEKQLRYHKELDIKIDKILTINEKENILEIKTQSDVYYGEKILLTLGRRCRKLNVPKEKELEGRGVFYCSICDAPLLKNKKAAIIGGGNSALLSVLDLNPFASKIYLLTNESFLRGDDSLQEIVKNNPKVEIIYNVKVLEIEGEKMVEGLKYKDLNNNEEKKLAIDGIFIQIGMQPNTELVKDIVSLNVNNEIIVEPLSGKTSHPKIWAAGDITNLPYKQISTAIGDGVRALLNIYNNIQKTDIKEFI